MGIIKLQGRPLLVDIKQAFYYIIPRFNKFDSCAINVGKFDEIGLKRIVTAKLNVLVYVFGF